MLLEPSRDNYLHGWDIDRFGDKPIVCSWPLTIHDTAEKPTSIVFDLLKGISPLIVGMDINHKGLL